MKWLLVDDESVNYGVLQHFVEHMFAHLSVELFFADSEEAAHEIIIKKKLGVRSKWRNYRIFMPF